MNKNFFTLEKLLTLKMRNDRILWKKLDLEFMPKQNGNFSYENLRNNSLGENQIFGLENLKN